MTTSELPRSIRWGEACVGFGTLALAALGGWAASSIPGEGVGSSVGPNVAPWFVVAMLALFGAILTAEAILRSAPVSGEEEHGAIDRRGALWMLLGLALNLTLIEFAGFIISSTLLFVCTARAFGSEKIARDAAIGFALAFFAYVGFDRLLGYKIGSGLIEQLF